MLACALLACACSRSKEGGADAAGAAPPGTIVVYPPVSAEDEGTLKVWFPNPPDGVRIDLWVDKKWRMEIPSFPAQLSVPLDSTVDFRATSLAIPCFSYSQLIYLTNTEPSRVVSLSVPDPVSAGPYGFPECSMPKETGFVRDATMCRGWPAEPVFELLGTSFRGRSGKVVDSERGVDVQR